MLVCQDPKCTSPTVTMLENTSRATGMKELWSVDAGIDTLQLSNCLSCMVYRGSTGTSTVVFVVHLQSGLNVGLLHAFV